MIDPLPSDIFQKGQILNNTYEIEGVLGRGGTGEVYRAKNLISERVVAIKALSAQFSGNTDYIELMKREEEMRNILHEAVVRYTECSRSDAGHVFLVMDYVAGPSVNDVMLRRRMDVHELMVIAHRVAEGLVATHKRGIVHRDLSPDNIILREGDPEKAVIIDFGIAKDTAAGARTIVGNEFAGKYEYAAPEQLDGHAEARSDLYALGALLLAAYRGQVPFLGNTPGEMVRRKQSPLDSEGVPEPLKALIDWLTAPKIEDRPADAAAVVARIDQSLKPVNHTRRGGGAAHDDETNGNRKRGLGWVLLPLVLAALGAGAWYGGLVERLFPPPLPVAAPYMLEASFAPGAPGMLSGHAPDAGTAAALEAAYAQATGAAPSSVTLELAQGMPGEDWPDQIAALFPVLQGLEKWELSIAGGAGTVEGLAADITARDTIEAALGDWSAVSRIALAPDIAAGPEFLPVDEVQGMLDSLASCGTLAQQDAPEEAYPLGASIVVTGDIARAEDRTMIAAAMAPVIGDRAVRVDATLLNEDLCAIRAVLPSRPASALSIWLGHGETGETNLSGIYHVNENPIAEVLAPAGTTEGSLWVMIVDNTGKVFHVLPQVNHTEHALSEIGRIESGLRRVRVLHSIEEFRVDQTKLAFRITDGDFGKSEIVAILSTAPLFDLRRPRDESVSSVARALAETLEGREAEILGVASRIIDARQ